MSADKKNHPNIGILYGGAIWHRDPWQYAFESFELIDVYKIMQKRFRWAKRLDLSKYDIVAIGWAPDQIFLKENESEILRFLSMGGVLVALGEFDLNWLPHTRYMRGFDNDIIITGAKDSIFKNLTSKEVSDWDDSAHGYFTSIPPGAKGIAQIGANEKRFFVAYIDNERYVGSLLAMTIDPDFHTYN